MEARRAHNPEVVGSSPASATIKAPDFDKKSGVFLTFLENCRMPENEKFNFNSTRPENYAFFKKMSDRISALFLSASSMT